MASHTSIWRRPPDGQIFMKGDTSVQMSPMNYLLSTPSTSTVLEAAESTFSLVIVEGEAVAKLVTQLPRSFLSPQGHSGCLVSTCETSFWTNGDGGADAQFQPCNPVSSACLSIAVDGP